MNDDPRDQPGPDDLDAARDRAQQWARHMSDTTAVAEAALAARGLAPVTIAHGDLESDEDARLIFDELPALAADAGRVTFRQGGGDHSTYVFAPPDADQAAAAFIAATLAIAPPWWRITATAHPVWR
ncbi:hypothetical protein [Nonomuraea sp. 10N515B]|uniref:hypothetical protein n=1 Tax=Nonomuraea sp. 10N515B TaxID=3457422 RepID=UPI003FCC532A